MHPHPPRWPTPRPAGSLPLLHLRIYFYTRLNLCKPCQSLQNNTGGSFVRMSGHVIWKVDETHGARWEEGGAGVDSRAPLEQDWFSLSARGNILEG